MRASLVLFFVILLASPCLAASNFDAYLGSQIVVGEKAQELMNQGKDTDAIELLDQGVDKFPDSDWLRSLYGRALFTQGDLDEAEDQFQRALEINPDNPVARMLIKEIRATKDALEDREMDELVDLGMDKLGDLGVIVIGVWLGTLMTSVSSRLAKSMARSNFDKALRRQDWDVVTDILENLIVNWKKHELRANMEKMLNKMEQAEVERIIIDYVDVQKHEDDLLFFLRKLHTRRG